MKTPLHWLSLAGLALALAAPAAAQGGGTKPGLRLDPDEKLTLTARFDPAVAHPGETVKLVLEAQVVFGWHAYGRLEETNIPVALSPDKLTLGGLEAVGPADIPPGDPHEFFGTMQYPLPQLFQVTQAIKVPDGMAPGEVAVKGRFDYQVCDENSCDPPAEAAFEAKLTVEAGAVRPEYSGAAAAGGEPPGEQGQGGEQKLKVTASFEPAVARAGETIQLVLDAETIPGWHAYGKLETSNKPIALPPGKLELSGLRTVGEADIPDGEPKELFGEIQYPLPESFQVFLEIAVPPGTAPGEVAIRGVLDYQVCDENSCDPQAAASFTAKLVVEAGAARPEYETEGEAAGGGEATAPVITAPKGADPFDSLWGLILLCIGGGLFALAMPCTYPMIPITFSFFTKQAEKRHGSVLPLALIYGLGIITMFVIVGVALSRVIIPFVNHWATNLVIGAVFLFFAFVLFGWVNFQPPRFLQNSAGKASQAGGLLGVFFMGAALVISSFTCTAPIVGSLIAKVAEYGSLRVGFGMGIFGLTMAIPFVALALMPTKVKAMPRSGEWMETLKVSLGFVELAAVIKFVSMVDISLGWRVLNRELFLMLTAGVFLLWAMYLFGFLRKAGEPYVGVGAGRQATGMAVVLFALYLLTGVLGYRLDFYTTSFAPPYSADLVLARAGGGGDGEHADPKGHTIVYDDPAKALEVAKAQDKLLLYNFTGFN